MPKVLYGRSAYKREAAKHEIDTDMTPEEAEKARKKSWIQILIGMPLFIGFIYLIFLLIRLMK